MGLSEFIAGEFTCWTKKEFHSITLMLLTQENVLDVIFKAKNWLSKLLCTTCVREKNQARHCGD